MSNRLGGGRRGTAYPGTNAVQPPDWNFNDRTPNQYDTQNVSVGDLWLDKSTLTVYVLVSLAGDVNSKGAKAKWIRWGGPGGDLSSLTGNSGGAVFGDADENIFIIGDTSTILATGNPADNTITLSVVGGRGAQSFPTDVGTAIPSSGVLNILGGPNINTSGGGNTVLVNLDTSILQPFTNSSGTQGVYALGVSDYATDRFMYGRGTGGTFLGRQAGSLAVTGTSNTGLGTSVMNGVTTGFSNTGVGDSALRDMTTGSLSVAVGSNALQRAVSSIQNTAVGVNSNQFNTTGQNNTSVGCFSLLAGTTGSDNTAIGFDAMANCDTASNNTTLGSQTLNSLTSGSGNIAIGYLSGSNLLTTDSNNIYINHSGVIGDNHIIRIGVSGSGALQQNKFFAAAIRGVTTDATDAIPVVISSTGQLGTAGGSFISGTWVPTITGASTAGVTTYSLQQGWYTVSGRVVTISFTVITTDATGTGNALISGLPIAIMATANYIPVGALAVSLTKNITTGVYGVNGTSTCLMYNSTGPAITFIPITDYSGITITTIGTLTYTI